ncbi:hypothetical protein CEXT_105441 [Caerostris extrusa]|uniref:Uncharacterized protein n=1 Tax=Caerostris extrusa TaxID=172846 RepID=A0AAV4NN70_CAEEX|nr:hypothetical protein CEXT_105441 [Caerostris extrusa]
MHNFTKRSWKERSLSAVGWFCMEHEPIYLQRMSGSRGKNGQKLISHGFASLVDFLRKMTFIAVIANFDKTVSRRQRTGDCYR